MDQFMSDRLAGWYVAPLSSAGAFLVFAGMIVLITTIVIMWCDVLSHFEG